MSFLMTAADGNWGAVSRFMSDMRNASRLGAYVDTVVEMYESGAWRQYTDATGRVDVWREREFDYFLIACGADYTDVQRLLSWDKAKAVDLAAAMDEGEDPARRWSGLHHRDAEPTDKHPGRIADITWDSH